MATLAIQESAGIQDTVEVGFLGTLATLEKKHPAIVGTLAYPDTVVTLASLDTAAILVSPDTVATLEQHQPVAIPAIQESVVTVAIQVYLATLATRESADIVDILDRQGTLDIQVHLDTAATLELHRLVGIAATQEFLVTVATLEQELPVIAVILVLHPLADILVTVAIQVSPDTVAILDTAVAESVATQDRAVTAVILD